MKTIEITVDPQGNSSVTTKGFSGSSCKHASEFIERSLGRPVSDQWTAEYHNVANSAQQLSLNSET